MTRIRCRDRHCTFNKNGICAAEEIEYEPDAGCLTMQVRADIEDEEEEREDEDELEELDDDEDDEDEDGKENKEYVSRRRKP